MSEIPLRTLVDDNDITPVINTSTDYNYYLCSHCLSPLMVWVRISIKGRCATL